MARGSEDTGEHTDGETGRNENIIRSLKYDTKVKIRWKCLYAVL